MAVETAVPLAEVAVVPMGGDDAPASTTSVASSLKSSAGGGATKSSESIGGEEEPQSPVPLDNNVDTSKAASSDAAVVQVQEETGEEEKTESTATPVSATSASPLARRGTTGNHRFSKLITEWQYVDRKLLKRQDFGLGLYVMPHDQGLRVTDVVPGGPAITTGEWRIDDWIVLVNGAKVVGLPDAEKIKLLTELPDDVEATLSVLVRSYDNFGQYRRQSAINVLTEFLVENVPLVRSEAGLGMSVYTNAEGAFVDEIVPNGIAHLSGLVRPNDRIIAINDQSIRSATTQSQIVEMLKGAAGTEVKLTLLTPNYLHPRHNRDPGATVPVKRDANEPSAGGCVVM